MSLGGMLAPSYISAFQPAFDAAYAAGVTVVAAAAMTAIARSIPCAFAHVICGGSDRQHRGARLLLRRQRLHRHLGPGVGIASTYLNNTYVLASGTSMATPHVSGVAALVLSAHPSETPAQIEAALEGTASDLGTQGWDEVYGWGKSMLPPRSPTRQRHQPPISPSMVSRAPMSPASPTMSRSPLSTATATPTLAMRHRPLDELRCAGSPGGDATLTAGVGTFAVTLDTPALSRLPPQTRGLLDHRFSERRRHHSAGSPNGVTATAGNAQATVSWTAPASTGGSA